MKKICYKNMKAQSREFIAIYIRVSISKIYISEINFRSFLSKRIIISQIDAHSLIQRN